jgi:RNA polymerase sigma-70 factor (ECF subfamily)
VLVNGGAGFVVIRDGVPAAVAGFTVAGGRVTEMDLLVDPVRLAELDLSAI